MPRNLSKNFIVIICTVFSITLMMEYGFCRTIKPEESYEFVKYDTRNNSHPDTIRLECKFLKSSSVNEVYWEYKKCGIGLDLVPCYSADNVSWRTVLCKNQSKICDVFSLKLINPSKNNSGLYRCNVKNYIAKEFKTFKTFELDVYDPKADIRVLKEHYNITNKMKTTYGNFDNLTVPINGTALFRCRVESLLRVEMIYLDKLDDFESSDKKCDNFSALVGKKQDSRYIPSYRPVKLDKHLYIAKFRLEKIQPYDSGSYICAAVVNTPDFIVTCKTMYLNILPEMFPDDDSAYSFLWILIFIPIFIVFVTVLVCVCHIHIYRLKVRKISSFYS